MMGYYEAEFRIKKKACQEVFAEESSSADSERMASRDSTREVPSPGYKQTGRVEEGSYSRGQR
jgi:hypothetical protein